MNKEPSANERWIDFLKFIDQLGDENPLRGMAKDLLDHCECARFEHSEGLLTEVTLTVMPKHKYLFGTSKEALAAAIHEWLDDNVYGNVLLAIKDDVEQIIILPKTKSVMEKSAMYEKEHCNPTYH